MKHKLTYVGGICGPGTIPGYGPPTGGAPLNIPVWPNAVVRSYPVCDISKYVGTLDLILKSYVRYLHLTDGGRRHTRSTSRVGR